MHDMYIYTCILYICTCDIACIYIYTDIVIDIHLTYGSDLPTHSWTVTKIPGRPCPPNRHSDRLPCQKPPPKK